MFTARIQPTQVNMNPFGQQKKIEGVKHVIAVGAGKGGVGKSTVAMNLARTLLKKGFRVGLLDADIYGPSVPRMAGIAQLRPNVNANKKIEPLVSHGLSTMSIGYLVDDQSAIIWRGPMLFKAIDQFLRDVEWGTLDFLIVDLPPGTGDVQLSLAQKVPMTGAVIVSTPQDMALIDVRRCIDMFAKVNTPILGVIENMSTFVCSHCHQETHLFTPGTLHQFCQDKGLELLGQIPFNPAIGDASEKGEVLEDGENPAFIQAAEKILKKIS